MATKDEIREQRESSKELKLATINLNRAADGLGAVGLDNRSFLAAFGKDLGKLGAFGKRFNILAKLQVAQFIAAKARNSKFNIAAKLRERKAAKLLAQQQNISRKEAKFLIKRAAVFKQEQSKIAAEKKYIEQFGVGAEFLAAEAKRKKSEQAKGQARNPDGSFKKGGKEAEGKERVKVSKEQKDRAQDLNQVKKVLKSQNKHFEKTEKYQKRMTRLTLIGNLQRTFAGARDLVTKTIGAVAGAGAFAFRKVIAPLLLLAGLTTFGGDLIDRLIVWLTGERKKIKIPGTDKEVSVGTAAAGTVGTALMFKKVRDALGITKLFSMLGFGFKKGKVVRIPSMGGKGPPVRTPVAPPKPVTGPNAAAVNRARQTAPALQKIEQAVQNLRNRLSKTFDTIKSAGKTIGKKALQLGGKIPPKLALKAGALGLGSIVAGASATLAPYVAPILAVGMAAVEGISAYNRAPELLNLPEAKVDWKKKLEVTFAGVLSGLSFTLVSTKQVLDGFEKVRAEFARRKMIVKKEQELAAAIKAGPGTAEQKKELMTQSLYLRNFAKDYGFFRKAFAKKGLRGQALEDAIFKQQTSIGGFLKRGISGQFSPTMMKTLGLRSDMSVADLRKQFDLMSSSAAKHYPKAVLADKFHEAGLKKGSIFVHDAHLARQLDNIFGTSAGNATARLKARFGTGASVINAPTTVAPNNTRNSSVTVATVMPHVDGHASMRMRR